MLETQTCPLCGQTHTAHVDGPHEQPACWRCLKQAREQAPAPAQMPGQLDLSMPRWTAAEAKAEARAMIADAREF